MGSNKRRGEPSVPSNYESLMTEDQLESMKKLEGFGWSIYIVRRPKFEPVEVVLEHNDGKHLRLLENGELDYDNPPDVRTDRPVEQATQPEKDPWADARDAGEFEVRDVPVEPEPATVGNEPVPTGGGGNRKPPKVLV